MTKKSLNRLRLTILMTIEVISVVPSSSVVVAVPVLMNRLNRLYMTPQLNVPHFESQDLVLGEMMVRLRQPTTHEVHISLAHAPLLRNAKSPYGSGWSPPCSVSNHTSSSNSSLPSISALLVTRDWPHEMFLHLPVHASLSRGPHSFATLVPLSPSQLTSTRKPRLWPDFPNTWQCIWAVTIPAQSTCYVKSRFFRSIRF